MRGPKEEAAGRLYRQAVRVSAEGLDPRGPLSPRALLALLQEAAGRDAAARGAGMARLMEDGLAWMLVRLVVEVARWPAGSEECALLTWPTRFGGASAEREFALESGAHTADGGLLVAEATSRWAVVDLAARRAVRMPAFVRGLPVAPERGAVRPTPSFERPASATLLGEREVEVEGADLDQLGHANNTRYLDWALQALPTGWDEGREIAHLDLTFRREARLGDRLRSRAYALGGDDVAHEIVTAASDDRDLCAQVLTRWRRR